MTTTIKDVAKKAGFSVATVSRVINQKGYISQNAIDRVMKAMKELNYQPNSAARRLQGKSVPTIGVILPSLDNPLYSEFFECVEQELNLKHYKTLLCISNNQPQKEEEYFNLLKGNQVEGIITGAHSDFMANKGRSDYPIISFDRKIAKEIPIVKSDNLEGGKAIARLVRNANVNSVLILSGSKEDFYPINDRLTGMLNIFNKSHIDVSTSALEFESSLSLKKILVNQLIQGKKYDAICCTDDMTAIMVKTCAEQIDYHPIITGYDGSTFIRTFFPSLPTVQQPLSEIAEFIINYLIKKIRHPNSISKNDYTFPIKTVGSIKAISNFSDKNNND